MFSSAAHSETFTVVSDYWCPYNCDPKADPEGFGLDLLRQSFEAKGIQVKYVLKPWDQALALAESNQVHAIMSANKTDSRKLKFPQYYFSRSTNCFFKRPDDDWSFRGLASLKGKKLAAIKSYSYGRLLDDYFQREHKAIHWGVGIDPLSLLLAKMDQGEIEIIIEDKHVFEYRQRATNQVDKYIEDYCLPAANIYMAFAPGHPDTKRFMKIYNDRMRVLLKGETYKQIMNRYK